MSDFRNLSPGIFEAAVQSLLECKQKARAIESVCESIVPLLATDRAKELVETCRESSAKIAHAFQTIYANNAKEAFVKDGDAQ